MKEKREEIIFPYRCPYCIQKEIQKLYIWLSKGCQSLKSRIICPAKDNTCKERKLEDVSEDTIGS